MLESSRLKLPAQQPHYICNVILLFIEIHIFSLSLRKGNGWKMFSGNYTCVGKHNWWCVSNMDIEICKTTQSSEVSKIGRYFCMKTGEIVKLPSFTCACVSVLANACRGGDELRFNYVKEWKQCGLADQEQH